MPVKRKTLEYHLLKYPSPRGFDPKELLQVARDLRKERGEIFHGTVDAELDEYMDTLPEDTKKQFENGNVTDIMQTFEMLAWRANRTVKLPPGVKYFIKRREPGIALMCYTWEGVEKVAQILDYKDFLNLDSLSPRARIKVYEPEDRYLKNNL